MWCAVFRESRKLFMKPFDPTGAVLVLGGGIGGIQASLDLADSGFKVYLVERPQQGAAASRYFFLFSAYSWLDVMMDI